MDGVEVLLDLSLRVFSHPVIDAAESLLYYLLIGILDDFFPYKELSAAVDVTETFVGSVYHKAEQSAFCLDISSDSRKGLKLLLEEGLDNLVVPANDSEKFQCRCSPGQNFCVSEVEIDIELNLIFEKANESLCNADIWQDEVFEELSHVF